MSPEGKANQIKMPPGPDAPIPKSRWFNAAESAEHHLKWMKQDCHRRQGAFNEEELVAIFNDYTDRRVLRAMNLDNERWLILSRFRNLLESNQRWAETRLAGGDFAVYEPPPAWGALSPPNRLGLWGPSGYRGEQSG